MRARATVAATAAATAAAATVGTTVVATLAAERNVATHDVLKYPSSPRPLAAATHHVHAAIRVKAGEELLDAEDLMPRHVGGIVEDEIDTPGPNLLAETAQVARVPLITDDDLDAARTVLRHHTDRGFDVRAVDMRLVAEVIEPHHQRAGTCT